MINENKVRTVIHTHTTLHINSSIKFIQIVENFKMIFNSMNTIQENVCSK